MLSLAFMNEPKEKIPSEIPDKPEWHPLVLAPTRKEKLRNAANRLLGLTIFGAISILPVAVVVSEVSEKVGLKTYYPDQDNEFTNSHLNCDHSKLMTIATNNTTWIDLVNISAPPIRKEPNYNGQPVRSVSADDMIAYLQDLNNIYSPNIQDGISVVAPKSGACEYK
jgi:hypothetical protein